MKQSQAECLVWQALPFRCSVWADQDKVSVQLNDDSIVLEFAHLEALAIAFGSERINIVYEKETPDWSEVTPGDSSQIYIQILLSE